MSGSLGFSTLVCLLNNGDDGQTETDANLLGPFWRLNSPRTANGGSIVRSPTPGPALFVNAWFRDARRQAGRGRRGRCLALLAGGLYENQDPAQADMNLRGKFTTDADGRISFRSVKPAGYPIPIDGPVGDLLRAQGRHNMRPAHLHFLAYKHGLQDADLAGLSARRQVSSTPTCSSASPATSSAITCATTSGPRRTPTCTRAVVLARPHLRHGAGRRASCRGRRSPARRHGERPQIPHLEPA